MDFLGGPQVQLYVSAAFILAAAVVALVCDYLKANNEQLRELAIELSARQEEDRMTPSFVDQAAIRNMLWNMKMAEEKETAAQSLDRAVERVAEKHAAVEANSEPREFKYNSRESKLARDAELAMERASQLVAVRQRKPQADAGPAGQGLAAPSDIRTQRKAVLRARLQHIAAQQAATGVKAPVEIANEPVVLTSAEAGTPAEASPSDRQKNLLDEILAATASGATGSAIHRETGRQRGAIREDLFASIQSRVGRLESKFGGLPLGAEFSETEFVIDGPAGSERLQRAIEAVSSSAVSKADNDDLPSGLQDGFVLSRLVQSRKPISGLVVSIGISGSNRETRPLPESVSQLIRSLLGPDDFGCQSGEEEFLLIFPHELGAAAHRKQAVIAERLWDFQLRSMSSLSILFSWGGVEVNGTSISDAISSATERMHETARNRKPAASTRETELVTEPARRLAV